MRIRSRFMRTPAVCRTILLFAFAAAVLVAGCGKKSTPEPPPGAGQTSSGQTPGMEPAPGQPAAGAGDAAKSPTGTMPKEIWAQIQKEQGQLDAVIQGAKLGEVHQHADKIRDLVAAAAAATTNLDANNDAKLQALVTGVGAVAAKLDKAADSGNSKLVQEHYAALQRQLKQLEVTLKTH